MKRTADVIVIGAGVVGNACAYYLSTFGADVLVLEREESLGEGGSSRNGGGVRQSGRDPRELPLAQYGVQHLWPHLSDELGVDVEYVQQGNLRLGKTERHLEILRGLTERARTCGLDMRMIDAQEVRAICPHLSDQVIGASWCPTDGHANPLITTLAFYRAARARGATFLSGVTARRIEKVRGRARRVITNQGVFEAPAIVLAAGLGSRPIAQSVGIDIPMRGLLIECLVTEAVEPLFPQMLGTADADFYGHQTAHGSFVFGGGSGLEEAMGDTGGVPTQSITAPAICRAIQSYVPALAQAKIVRTWAGWEDESIDGVPVISAIDEVPGLTIGCAFTGHGFGIAPVTGLLLAQLASGKPTALDLSAFRYDRFHALG